MYVSTNRLPQSFLASEIIYVLLTDTLDRFIWDKSIDYRVCYNCGSYETFIDKKGRKHWYSHEDHWYCNKCDNNLFKNPKYRPDGVYMRIWFKNRGIRLKENPRKGVCSICGKKVGDEFINYSGKVVRIKKTHIHHINYHDDDPLKDTIEVCPQCHMKETRR